MISFIIIGRNEGWKLTKCLESVFNTIRFNKLQNFEVIFIDSDSTDDSIERAKKFKPVKSFKITGKYNAAVARNIGVKVSTGDVLFFIDGDMELKPDFYQYVFTKNLQNPDYQFVNGYWCNKYFDSKGNYLFTEDIKTSSKPFYRNVTGGLMIATSDLWGEIGGMDERLIRNEDIDFGLRMSKIGFPVLVYPYVFAYHNTVSYFDENRTKSLILSKSLLCPGLVMRKHLFNQAYFKVYYRNVIYVFYLLLSFIILILLPSLGAGLFLIYFSIQFVRAIYRKKETESLYNSFLYKSLFSIYSLVGFLFYFPNKPKYQIIEIGK